MHLLALSDIQHSTARLHLSDKNGCFMLFGFLFCYFRNAFSIRVIVILFSYYHRTIEI